jgi:uncharacterized DUF497 family protein
MNTISFSWDEKKADESLKKHKVSFEEAQSVFSDPNARMIYDLDHSNDEERFIILGLSSTLRILVVCHSYREDDRVIRIISTRKANKNEQNQYWNFIS